MKYMFVVALLIGAFGINVAYAEEKKVCQTQVDPKTKKEKQVCKTVKIHKKLEGTEIPAKK